jgi:hypothetical protein
MCYSAASDQSHRKQKKLMQGLAGLSEVLTSFLLYGKSTEWLTFYDPGLSRYCKEHGLALVWESRMKNARRTMSRDDEAGMSGIPPSSPLFRTLDLLQSGTTCGFGL